MILVRKSFFLIEGRGPLVVVCLLLGTDVVGLFVGLLSLEALLVCVVFLCWVTEFPLEFLPFSAWEFCRERVVAALPVWVVLMTTEFPLVFNLLSAGAFCRERVVAALPVWVVLGTTEGPVGV